MLRSTVITSTSVEEQHEAPLKLLEYIMLYADSDACSSLTDTLGMHCFKALLAVEHCLAESNNEENVIIRRPSSVEFAFVSASSALYCGIDWTQEEVVVLQTSLDAQSELDRQHFPELQQ